MEDSQIVALYFARSEQAIRESEHKYGHRVWGVANGILRNAADAEECASDTWLRAWNTMPPTRPESLAGYLLRIVRNLSIDRLRRAKALKRGEAALVLNELKEVAADVPDAAEGAAIAAVIDRFLAGQPSQRRVMFLRRYWYMDGIADIAARVGKTEAAVRMTLMRMRKGLRAALEEEGITL